MNKIEEANLYLGAYIHGECKDYALSKMKKDDFILLVDAKCEPTNDIVFACDKTKKLMTLKNSKRYEYNEHYEKKLIEVVERILNTKEKKSWLKTIWQSLKTLMGKNI